MAPCLAILYSHRVPRSCEAVASSILRCFEEFGIGKVVAIATKARDRCLEILEKVCTELGIRFEIAYLAGVDEVERVLDASLSDASSPDYNVVEWLDRRVLNSLIEDSSCSELYLALGAAGRRLTAALVLALLANLARRVQRREDGRELLGRVRIVHTEFYFGEWLGLSYPYTPRRLEPIAILYPVPQNLPSGVRLERVPSELRKLVEGLPPLRRSVAEIAKELNLASEGRVLAPGAKKCGVLKVCFSDRCFEADLCSEDEVAQLLDDVLRELSIEDEEVRALLGFRYPLRMDRKMLVDTSLIYRGIHLEAFANPGSVAIPHCTVAEIVRRVAESLKKRGNAKDVLAYLALRDALSTSTIVPTPPPPCDTAIPCMDPMLAINVVLATTDKGAYRLWKALPISRIAEVSDANHLDNVTKPVTARELLSGAKCSEDDHVCDHQKLLARLYYALHQTLAYVALLQKLNERGIAISTTMPKTRISIIDTEGKERNISPPLDHVLKDLAIE